MTVAASEAGSQRVGLVVSKAVGNAVVRNRTKRVLRHRMAALLPSLPDQTDVVVRANPAAGTAAASELRHDLDGLLSAAIKRRR